ncbi:MFS transporter [Conexivisphaera calida]|uniref:Predicted thiamin transporter ThiT n=1 Tax=Conexivisphaera calida TaxID=1874277 RepID=A0A4P2VM21_9ARCH|nr:MFS transporter [Conexivisphaera calida]BBE42145.1 Predicted thiamin transporter ThiT [Conexivisphaera calida]
MSTRELQGLATLSVFMSTFLWGFSEAIASLTTQWPFVPADAYLYMLLAMPVGLISGNLAMGHLADRYGRKPVMMAALVIYSVGVALVALASTWQVLALGVGTIVFSIGGGDEPALLSYLAETTSERSRGSLVMLASNGANVAAATAAAIFILAGVDFHLQRTALVITLALALPLVIVVRRALPESAAWRRVRARANAAARGNGVWLGGPAKLYFLVTIALTTVLTYGLVSWAMGPYYYPHMISLVTLLFNVGAAAGGILGYATVERAGRRVLSTAYYAGGLVTGIAIILQLILSPGDFPLFAALLIVNGVFAQLTWGLRLVMETELFHTASRATSIAIVRTSAWVVYMASLVFTQSFTVTSFMAYDVALWALGVSGAVVWATLGYETRGKTIEELDSLA